MSDTKQAIIKRLVEARRPLAVHEFDIPGHSENSIASRLPEMAKIKIVEGRRRRGCAYKEWSLLVVL